MKQLKEYMLKKAKNKKIIWVLAGLAAIMLVLFLFWGGRQLFLLDSRTVQVQDPKDLKKQVQKDADESMVSIRINSQIEMDSPDAKAPLYIRNLAENKYDFYVELRSEETQKTIYKSKTLKPGESIQQDTLKDMEETGSHPYTAYFYIMEDGEEISTVEYAVTIEVKGGDSNA